MQPQHLPLVVLGSNAGKRIKLLQAARLSLGMPAAQLVEWRDWLTEPSLLDRSLHTPCYFKIDTAGEDQQVQHQLRLLGCQLLQRPSVAPAEHGELVTLDAWFAGFADAMQRLQAQLANYPHVSIFNRPDELVLMTDKLACQQHLIQHDVATPTLLGSIASYAQLRAVMEEQQLDRLFFKVRYGSSASGVVAYRKTRDGREQATTSAQLVDDAQGARLFNVKRLCRYTSSAAIRELIDMLASQGAYAETWLSKPRCGNGHFDMRVVTMGGQPAHRVARIGAQAMTNLHLDNQRGDAATLLNPTDQTALETTASQAARAFPHSHVIGFDIVVNQGQARVLEANAFGDLLPGLLWQGQDTYAAQMTAFSVAHESR